MEEGRLLWEVCYLGGDRESVVIMGQRDPGGRWLEEREEKEERAEKEEREEKEGNPPWGIEESQYNYPVMSEQCRHLKLNSTVYILCKKHILRKKENNITLNNIFLMEADTYIFQQNSLLVLLLIQHRSFTQFSIRTSKPLEAG